MIYKIELAAITYTHSAVALVFERLTDHVANTALVGVTHRSADAANFKFLQCMSGGVHCCHAEEHVYMAGWYWFTYVQACRLGLGGGDGGGDAGDEAEDEDGGLHFEW